MNEEEAAVRDEEEAADAEQLDHHAEIFRSSHLLVHTSFLMRDTNEQKNIEEEHEQNQGESVCDLFVEGHNVTRGQVARGCASGDGVVVGVLTWVENEKDEIVDQWVHAAEAQRNVVSEEASQPCAVPPTVKDEDVPFERGPCQEQEAGGEQIVVNEIGEHAVGDTGGPPHTCVEIRQLNWYIGECLKAAGDEEKNDDMVIERGVQCSRCQKVEQEKDEAWNRDNGDDEQETELQRTRCIERMNIDQRAIVERGHDGNGRVVRNEVGSGAQMRQKTDQVLSLTAKSDGITIHGLDSVRGQRLKHWEPLVRDLSQRVSSESSRTSSKMCNCLEKSSSIVPGRWFR